MFEIEAVNDRLIRIDDAYIPAVNVQVEGFPQEIDGHEYGISFEVLWEVEDHRWEVERFNGDVVLEMIGPMGCLMDAKSFKTWSEFKDYFLAVREDPYRGYSLGRLPNMDEILDGVS